MGGKSHSEFKVDNSTALGHWFGAVEIVPALQAPGFCNLQSTPLREHTSFPDVTGTVSFGNM